MRRRSEGSRTAGCQPDKCRPHGEDADKNADPSVADGFEFYGDVGIGQQDVINRQRHLPAGVTDAQWSGANPRGEVRQRAKNEQQGQQALMLRQNKKQRPHARKSPQHRARQTEVLFADLRMAQGERRHHAGHHARVNAIPCRQRHEDISGHCPRRCPQGEGNINRIGFPIGCHDRLGGQLPVHPRRFPGDQSFRNVPEPLAQVSSVQASEARLRAARAKRLPTLALDAVALHNRFNPTTGNSMPFDQVSQNFQNYGGFLTVQWPLFTGFATSNQIRLAETTSQAAKEELQLMREQVISEVWTTYVQAKNAIVRREAAASLEAASKSSYQSALAGFNQGITPLQDLFITRAAYAQATAFVAESDAVLAQAVTTFTLNTGGL